MKKESQSPRNSAHQLADIEIRSFKILDTIRRLTYLSIFILAGCIPLRGVTVDQSETQTPRDRRTPEDSPRRTNAAPVDNMSIMAPDGLPRADLFHFLEAMNPTQRTQYELDRENYLQSMDFDRSRMISGLSFELEILRDRLATIEDDSKEWASLLRRIRTAEHKLRVLMFGQSFDNLSFR